MLRALALAACLAACSSTTSQGQARSEQSAHAHHGAATARSGSGSRYDANLGCRVSAVYFDQGSAELGDEDRSRLRDLGRCLERHEVDTLYIVGRTDPVGTPEFNRELGRQRAQAVAHYLESLGTSTNFVVKSRGEDGATNDEVLWPRQRAVVSVSVPPQH